MRKNRNLIIGGLQQRIFNLVLFTIIIWSRRRAPCSAVLSRFPNAYSILATSRRESVPRKGTSEA